MGFVVDTSATNASAKTSEALNKPSHANQRVNDLSKLYMFPEMGNLTLLGSPREELTQYSEALDAASQALVLDTLMLLQRKIGPLAALALVNEAAKSLSPGRGRKKGSKTLNNDHELLGLYFDACRHTEEYSRVPTRLAEALDATSTGKYGNGAEAIARRIRTLVKAYDAERTHYRENPSKLTLLGQAFEDDRISADSRRHGKVGN